MILLALSIIYLLYTVTIHNSISSILYSILPTLFISAIGYLFAPIRIEIDSFLNRGKLRPFCMIYLYGKSATGKTSLIKSWLQGNQGYERSTENFFYYKHKISDFSRNQGKQKFTRIRVADYQGQKQSQLLIAERIPANALLFMVDIAPRSDENHKLLDNQEKQLEYLGTNTEEKIQKRLEEHYIYIVGTLEPLFEKLYSNQLFVVRLVINKCDLIEKIIQMGLIPNTNPNEYEQYATELFKKVEDEIIKACMMNNIQDYSVILTSTARDYNTRNLLNDIVAVYKNRIINF